jgi:hypothetical protein
MQRTLEGRLFRRYWDDGLLDLLVGIGVLVIGIGWVCDQVALAAVTPALLVPLWGPLRARLVEPRLGAVAFADKRVRRQRRHALGLVAGGVVAFLIAVAFVLRGAGDGAAPGPWIAAMPPLLMALPAAVVGASLGLGRFFVYAGVLVAVAPVIVLLDTNPGWAFIAGAVAPLVLGAGLLARLLRIDAEVEG